jgi:transposase
MCYYQLYSFYLPAELGNIVKSVVIKRESDGKYYVIMAIEHDFTKELEKTGEKCGIDLNIKNIAISTNRKEDMMKAIKKLKKYDKKYLKIQKELTTRYELKSRSKTTKKLQKKQNKIHKFTIIYF